MAEFIPVNITPIGANSRQGKAPQVFAYKTEDTTADMRADGYFNALKGDVKTGDWLQASTTIAGTNSYGYWIFNRDGFEKNKAINPSIGSAAGTGYATNDYASVSWPNSVGVITTTIVKITAQTGGVPTGISIYDAGEFATPSYVYEATYLNLTTTKITGSGTGLKVSFGAATGTKPGIEEVPAGTGDITLNLKQLLATT